MKLKMFRLISLILTLSFLLSAFAVMTFASPEAVGSETYGEEETEEEEIDFSQISLYLYRNFDEGWSFKNGLTYANKDGDFSIDYEETDDFGYNYYFSVGTKGVQDDFVNAPATIGNEYTIMQFDIKAKDFCNSGTLYGRVPSGVNAPNIQLYRINNGRLYLPQNNADGLYTHSATPTKDIGELNDTWVHLVYVFHHVDFGKEADEQLGYVDVTVCYGDADFFDYDDPTTYETYDLRWTRNENQSDYSMISFELFRFGFPSTSSTRMDYYCLDNMALYTGSKKPITCEELNENLGFGSKVSTSQAKTVTILSAAGGEKSTTDYLNDGLMMKNNVEYALLRNQRVGIYTDENGVAYGAPRVVDGKVMLPLEAILNYIGYPVYVHPDGISYDISTGTGASYITLGRNTASVNGERVELTVAPGIITDQKTGKSYAVICADDVNTLFSGYYLTYDNMGLSIICEKENVLNRADHLETMVSYMKLFVSRGSF